MSFNHSTISSEITVEPKIQTHEAECKNSIINTNLYKPPELALTSWGLDKAEGVTFMRGKGCFHCKDTGYKGRTGLFETLLIDEMVQQMTLEVRSAQEISRAAEKAGTFRPLMEDAKEKVKKGITTLEEAASAVMV